MAASVFILHGATIIPSVGNDPLAIGAVWSAVPCTTDARFCTSRTVRLVSNSIVVRAHRDSTKWVSTPAPASHSSNRMPMMAPVAPVIPITRRNPVASSHATMSAITVLRPVHRE